jgi:hypothetical protein
MKIQHLRLTTTMSPVNRLEFVPSINQLVATTNVDHLLPEEERPLALQAREEFEAVGREMDRRLTRKALYPIFYESTCKKIAAGMSNDDVRAELTMLADTDDDLFASILIEAYEDALAGRQPREQA